MLLLPSLTMTAMPTPHSPGRRCKSTTCCRSPRGSGCCKSTAPLQMSPSRRSHRRAPQQVSNPDRCARLLDPVTVRFASIWFGPPGALPSRSGALPFQIAASAGLLSVARLQAVFLATVPGCLTSGCLTSLLQVPIASALRHPSLNASPGSQRRFLRCSDLRCCCTTTMLGLLRENYLNHASSAWACYGCPGS